MMTNDGGSAATLGARRSREWGRIVAAMVWAGMSGLVYLAAVVGVWGLFSAWFVPQWTLLLAVVLGLIISGMARPVVMLLSMLGSLGIQRDLREQLLRHLDQLPLGWFTSRSAGRVKQAVHDDVNLLHGVYGEIYVWIARSLTIAIGSAVVFFVAAPLFAVVAAIPTVVAVIATRRRKPKSGPLTEASKRLAVAEATVNIRSIESVQGAEVWRVYSGAGDGGDRVAAALDAREAAATAQDAATAADGRVLAVLSHPLTGVAWVVVIGAVFAGAGWLVPSALVPFILLIEAFGDAVEQVVGSRAQLGRARIVAEDYETVMAEAPLAPVRGTAETSPSRAGVEAAIELEAVTFGYEQGRTALTDVSVLAERGQTVALVGASGAGKSTIARLIPRFWDVGAGAVRVLGDDVRDLEPAELYRRVSFVFQDVQLLHRSVRDNIRLGDADADEARIVAAARAAHVHDRILALPRGYDSIVGEDAVFSGGEAQRVSIARALLLDAPIVVLDEATAHADAESEEAIHDAVGALARGRTTLVIAHRLSTIQRADRIVVLESGRVVEQGTFAQLVAAGGVFARLWTLQEAAASSAEREVTTDAA